jgi:hypothetical protein
VQSGVVMFVISLSKHPRWSSGFSLPAIDSPTKQAEA